MPFKLGRLVIHVANEQQALALDCDRLRTAAERILTGAGISQALVSLAIVDDPTIHKLNQEFLKHDYPTDVLSFLLERENDRLEGEVIASADTAIRNASQFGWSPADELLLYVIHGMLHLIGFDDTSPDAREKMQAAEQCYLAQFGLKPHD